MAAYLTVTLGPCDPSPPSFSLTSDFLTSVLYVASRVEGHDVLYCFSDCSRKIDGESRERQKYQ